MYVLFVIADVCPIQCCAQLIVVLLMQVPTSALEPEVAKMTSESHLYYNKGLYCGLFIVTGHDQSLQ